MRPDHDRRLPGRDRARARAGRRRRQRARSAASTGTPTSSSRARQRLEVLAREQVGRRQQRALAARPARRRASAHAATAVLPMPTSPWSRRSIGVGAPRSSRIVVDGRVLVRRERRRRAPSLRPSAPSSAARTRRPPRRRPRSARRRVPPALPAPPDHAELERQQLVEGEPAQRAVATLERRRVVRLLQGVGDRRQPSRLPDRRRAGIRDTGRRRGRAPRGSRPGAGPRSARREPVDGHDPPAWSSSSSRPRPAGTPGCRTCSLPAEVLELAATRRPCRPGAAGARCSGARTTSPRRCPSRREDGDRALDPPAERRLDADVQHVHARAHDRAVLDPARGRRACASRAGRRSGGAGGTAGRERCRGRCAARPVASVARPRQARLAERCVEQLDGAARRAGPSVGAVPGARGRPPAARTPRSRPGLLRRDEVAVVRLAAVQDTSTSIAGCRVLDPARSASASARSPPSP